MQSIVWDSNPGSRKVKVANQFTQVRRPLCLDEFAPLKQNNDFHLVHVDSLLGGTDHASKSSKMKLFCSNYWSLERPILRTVPRWISCFRAAKNSWTRSEMITQIIHQYRLHLVQSVKKTFLTILWEKTGDEDLCFEFF